MEATSSTGPAITPEVQAGPPEAPRPSATGLARIPRRALFAGVAVAVLAAGGLVAWLLLGSSGYVIKADAFATDKNQCTLVVNLSGGGAGGLKVQVESGSVTVSHGSGFPSPFCTGAKHTWLGTVSHSGYTFTSDATTPLQFEVTDDGYKYVSGKGTVGQPDGKIVTLGG
jgi:hypothetical protein